MEVSRLAKFQSHQNYKSGLLPHPIVESSRLSIRSVQCSQTHRRPCWETAPFQVGAPGMESARNHPRVHHLLTVPVRTIRPLEEEPLGNDFHSVAIPLQMAPHVACSPLESRRSRLYDKSKSHPSTNSDQNPSRLAAGFLSKDIHPAHIHTISCTLPQIVLGLVRYRFHRKLSQWDQSTQAPLWSKRLNVRDGLGNSFVHMDLPTKGKKIALGICLFCF